MTAEIDSLVLEHLRAIRADIAGLSVAVYGSKSDLDDVKRRIDRIERRLDLTDPAH